MYRWIVTVTRECCTECIDREYEVLFKYECEAEEFVERQKVFWKDFIEINKVPERTFKIRRYKHDERNQSTEQDGLAPGE